MSEIKDDDLPDEDAGDDLPDEDAGDNKQQTDSDDLPDEDTGDDLPDEDAGDNKQQTDSDDLPNEDAGDDLPDEDAGDNKQTDSDDLPDEDNNADLPDDNASGDRDASSDSRSTIAEKAKWALDAAGFAAGIASSVLPQGDASALQRPDREPCGPSVIEHRLTPDEKANTDVLEERFRKIEEEKEGAEIYDGTKAKEAEELIEEGKTTAQGDEKAKRQGTQQI